MLLHSCPGPQSGQWLQAGRATSLLVKRTSRDCHRCARPPLGGGPCGKDASPAFRSKPPDFQFTGAGAAENLGGGLRISDVNNRRCQTGAVDRSTESRHGLARCPQATARRRSRRRSPGGDEGRLQSAAAAQARVPGRRGVAQQAVAGPAPRTDVVRPRSASSVATALLRARQEPTSLHSRMARACRADHNDPRLPTARGCSGDGNCCSDSDQGARGRP
jgi:hypothetical protein